MPGTRRPVVDYDGRGDEPTTVGNVLIWGPRIALSPLYLVSEYVIRRPLGWVISSAEEEEVPQKVVEAFTFGPKNNIAVVPTGLVDFGLRPSAGIYFRYNEFLAPTNALRARVAYGGRDWFYVALADRVQLASHQEVSLRLEYGLRPDNIFHGIGPETSSARARYKATRVETGLSYAAGLWRSSNFSSFVAVRAVSFDPTTGAFSEPTVADEVVRGRFVLPPGMASGYVALVHGGQIALDTRRPRNLEDAPPASDFVSPPGTGLRLALRGEHGVGLRDAPQPTSRTPTRYAWVGYGASLGGYLDLTGTQRVVGLAFVADFVDPVEKEGTVPFTEQATLGGARPLRGFLDGRLVDRSAVAVIADYQWPIWVWLDGSLSYSVGNVFGERVNDLDLVLLRQSIGMGFRSTSSRDHAFELMLAFGTETFDAGAEIESVRFVVGATNGF